MSAELISIPKPVEPAPDDEQDVQNPVLSIAQRRALLALLTHPNIRQAAKSVGVHERTLRRWLATPIFRDALDAFLESTQDELLDDLEQGAFTAVATLRSIAANKYAGASGRIAASKHLLEFCERRTLRSDLVSLLRRP
jgi:hypothetical protein